MKKIVFIFITCLSFLSVYPNTNDTLKILAIGNSFSEDALEAHLSPLSIAEGRKIVIGNLVIGGCSLERHWNNALGNKADYQFRKIDVDGNRQVVFNKTLKEGLDDEEWDFIAFQQVSYLSGDYGSIVEHLPLLLNYVKEIVDRDDVKYVFQQSWAYSHDSQHIEFTRYDCDQQKMYDMIVDATFRATDSIGIDMVIPAGTAIQNGRTSCVGDNFCRDGYHLNFGIGRYTAACVWFEKLFGIPVLENPYKPSTMSDEEIKIAKYAAHYAVIQPQKITQISDTVSE